MISGAITISTIENSEVFPDDLPDDSEAATDRNSYRGAAGWVIFVALVVIITQIIMVIFGGLFFGGIIKNNFAAFAIVVS